MFIPLISCTQSVFLTMKASDWNNIFALSECTCSYMLILLISCSGLCSKVPSHKRSRFLITRTKNLWRRDIDDDKLHNSTSSVGHKIFFTFILDHCLTEISWGIRTVFVENLSQSISYNSGPKCHTPSKCRTCAWNAGRHTLWVKLTGARALLIKLFKYDTRC